MADFGDIKPTPAAEETFSMPARDSSLDDFEKLENFCIQNKPETESQPDHDVQSSHKKQEGIEYSLVSIDSNTKQPLDDPTRPTRREEQDNEFKDNVSLSSGKNDHLSELLDFGSDTESSQPAMTLTESAVNGTNNILEMDIAASADFSDVLTSSSILPNKESDFRAGLKEVEKPVYPAPSDSGYGLSPSDETSVEPPVDDTRFDKIVPSAPEIAHYVSAADSLVSGQLQRRSPSPVEIPRQQEIPIKKPVYPISTPPVSSIKMTNDEVSSTERAYPGCPFSPSALFDPKRLHPCVTQLVYWQEPKKSGAVFGTLLLLLLSLRFFSLISVVSYLALGVLSVTLSFRIYKNILQAVQKSGDGHPFKEYLEYDLNVSQDKVHETADTLVKHVNCTVQKLRSLFLVEDLVDSIKLGIVLWSFTYLGAWFNGLTLIILGVIAIFTLPKLYESNQTLIDQYISMGCAQVSGVLSVVKSKIPFGKKEKSQ